MQSDDFIRSNFKIRFILSFCAIVLIGAAASGIILYIVTYKDIGSIYPQALRTLRDTRLLLLPAILITVIFQVMVITIAIASIALFASHKIVGPLYRLGISLKKACSGVLLTSIRFRATDPIEQAADIFNCMSASLCQRIERIQEGMSKIIDIERRMEELTLGSEAERDKAKDFKDAFERETQEIKKVLSEFKID